MDDDPIRRSLRARIKYDTLQEVLLNLEYDNAFCGLGHNEEELLNIYREVWNDCHIGKSSLSSVREGSNSDIADLFWSRFEEKIDEKLTSLGDDLMKVEDPEIIKQSNKIQQGKLFRQVARLSEITSEAVSAQRELFCRRRDMQKNLIRALGRVLSCEVKALATQTNKLEGRISNFLLQPSQRTFVLQSTYTALLNEKNELEAQVSKLTEIVNAYKANERRYLELACQKADAQRQINFIQHLQKQQKGEPEQKVLMQKEDERRDLGEGIEDVIPSSSEGKKWTAEEEERIENNRNKVLDLLNYRGVVDRQRTNIVIKGAPVHHSKPIDTGGGFFIDPPPLSQSQGVIHFEKSEEETDQSDEDLGEGIKRRKKRRRKLPPPQSPPKERLSSSQLPPEAALIVPRPPDEEKPVCDECSRTFDDSFLLNNFDCQVCDGCRDHQGIHSLITRTAAKDRYLISDVDLDIREPPLRRIFKKNPRNSTWGDMQLFLEAQVAARSLEIWGSEENVEAERANRVAKREKAKERGFQKRVRELRLQVRSSLYTKKTATHEHIYGPEVYNEATDTYSKSCTSCDHKMTFEKM
ncbi:unnamed protein product [Hymenolepis diminuta]|uniref:XPA_C domain-containing protein n=2 Tax=Hymenolepis diminuta TaxID=6216 RepID=A0A0R3SRL5_HYMDI|nr:unnamed protein product [Hymenolepis diminuta]